MIRLAVRVRGEQAELVLAELLELAPAGVEETRLGDVVEYAVYGTPGELPALPALNAVAGDALIEISTSEVADDWRESWKRFHRPVLIPPPPSSSPPPSSPASQASLPSSSPPSSSSPGSAAPVPGLHVRPPWEPPSAAAEGPLREIVIDPGQAFGTGGHASTRLCLELLLQLAADGRATGPLLDVGTGSGVLAIAAASLGYAPVLALDNERESVEAARSNARVNGVELQLRRLDLRTQQLPWIGALETGAREPAAGEVTVLANLLRPLLIELAAKTIATPADLLAGGLLRHEVDEVVAAFARRLGLRERARRASGEWAAVWLSAR